MIWTVSVWFIGNDIEDLKAQAKCVRQAAEARECSSGTRLGPPLVHDMQFRCISAEDATELLDRVIVECPGVKGEVIKQEDA